MQALPKVAPPGPPLPTETPQATRKVRRMALHQALARRPLPLAYSSERCSYAAINGARLSHGSKAHAQGFNLTELSSIVSAWERVM
jgi:hypothetical protein